MSVTSGWGRLTWDQSQWGGSTVLLEGWGARAWSENEWGELGDVTVTLTGVSATVSLGDSEEFNETGWGRLAWNDADWGEGRDETVSLTGIEITSSPGSINTEVAYLLEMIGSNHSLTSSVGSPEVFGEIGVPLTGVSAEFATPTMSYVGTLVGWGRDSWGDNSWGESPNQVIPLVGQDATASVGAPTLEFAYELSSQVATTSVGSLSFVISPTISLTGQAATSDEGLLGLAFGTSTEPVTGIALTSSLGTPGLEFGPSAITGVAATTSVGEITVGSVELINVTGVAATSGIGSVTLEFTYELSGQSSTSAVGSITPTDVIQGLVTDPLTSTVGLLGIEAYANIDTGSNTSYTSVATGSNSSYSNVATGSNTSYSDVA